MLSAMHNLRQKVMKGSRAVLVLTFLLPVSLASCGSEGPSGECAKDQDCTGILDPGCRWVCENRTCRQQCEDMCSIAGHCLDQDWPLVCRGHWECTSGECLAVCDDNRCTAPADCTGEPWPLPFPGHWDCRKDRCRPALELPRCLEKIPFHEVVLDSQARILPWTPFDRVIRLAMGFIETCPRDPTDGLPWYMKYCDFRFETMKPKTWPHNPAGLCGMMVETLIRYMPYSGDRKWVEIVRRPLDHLIAQSTPPDYLWPGVPYASADNSGIYRGGSYEGIDGIQPDKVAQAAVGYVRFFKTTGQRRYLDEAVQCAEVLAGKVRPGDEFHSPWPFRVNARTGRVIEEYTSDVLWPIVLFDELTGLGLATPGQAAAREAAWTWLMDYPMKNMRWKGYFEDVELDRKNRNRDQYTPGEVARYLIRHPDLDPAWREHVPQLLSWIKATLGDTQEKWHGATGIREQLRWLQLSGSHTARYASLCALWFEAGGGEAFREEALRSFSLATYFARQDGIVIFSICDQDVWFSDGYFDYVPHFLDGMSAVPEMAPAEEDHLLSSSSVIRDIRYAPGRIAYKAFDPQGNEILKIAFFPASVRADGVKMSPREDEDPRPGYSFDPSLRVLRVHRLNSRHIVISGAGDRPGS
jgi:hypothetical protein